MSLKLICDLQALQSPDSIEQSTCRALKKGISRWNPVSLTLIIPQMLRTDVLAVSIYEFEIIDNVPTSTWNKFVTLLKHEPWPHSSPIHAIKCCAFTPSRRSRHFRVSNRVLRVQDKRFELIDEYPDIVFIQNWLIQLS
ncbi:CMF_collapsed_G0045220.mRNA.1.CDS.1 [Saccharomyces cerevisiae]|nr:CMF_collapsed_G0045220.mRNA.1.CDS.1 [Saccharomyces cerevisiae]